MSKLAVPAAVTVPWEVTENRCKKLLWSCGRTKGNVINGCNYFLFKMYGSRVRLLLGA